MQNLHHHLRIKSDFVLLLVAGTAELVLHLLVLATVSYTHLTLPTKRIV